MQTMHKMDLVNPQQKTNLTDMDEILFTLICQGETDLANKYLKNYLRFVNLDEDLGDYEI